jgi:hypothetical protein
MYRVIAHYPPSDHPDREPQARHGGSITYDYAARAEAQERYTREVRDTHSVELWWIGSSLASMSPSWSIVIATS